MSESNWVLAKASARLGPLTRVDLVMYARFACVKHESYVLCFDLLTWLFLLPLAMSMALEIAGRGD